MMLTFDCIITSAASGPQTSDNQIKNKKNRSTADTAMCKIFGATEKILITNSYEEKPINTKLREKK